MKDAHGQSLVATPLQLSRIYLFTMRPKQAQNKMDDGFLREAR